jgi:hypothetical protein
MTRNYDSVSEYGPTFGLPTDLLGGEGSIFDGHEGRPRSAKVTTEFDEI